MDQRTLWSRSLLAAAGACVIAAIGVAQFGSPRTLIARQDSLAEAQTAVAPVAKPGTEATKQAESDPTALIRHGRKAPLPKTPGTIRLATYNLENLFDDKDDPALSGEFEDKDMTKPPAHLRALAKAIRLIDADVLAFQEVESLEALRWFMDAHLTGLGYHHVVSLDAGDHRGIECSVISRFPLDGAEVFKEMPLGGIHPAKWGNEPNKDAGQPVTFRRSPLKVNVRVPATVSEKMRAAASPEIQARVVAPPASGPATLPAPAADAAPGYSLTLFAVHFKSGRPGGYWREAEAKKTNELAGQILKADPAAKVVILGDFNAHSGEEPVKILARAGWFDLFRDRTSKDATTMTHSSERAIDHILFNPNALAEVALDSRFVLGTPTRPAGVDWRTTPPPEGYGSDHYPVVVDLYPFNLAPLDASKLPPDRILRTRSGEGASDEAVPSTPTSPPAAPGTSPEPKR